MSEDKEVVFCERDNLKVMETGCGVELKQLYDVVIGFSWKTENEFKRPNCIKEGMTFSEIQNAMRNISKEERDEMDNFVDETPEPIMVFLDKYGRCKNIDNFIFYNSNNIPNGIVIPDIYEVDEEEDEDVFMKNLKNIGNVEGDKECIGVDLLRLSKDVDSIVVYLTSRDEDKTFNTIHDVSITIYNSDTMEALCKYSLPEDNNDNRSRKMVTIKITDRIHGSWLVHSDGENSKEHIQELANKHICL
jgi:Uncharacterized proteins involved in stress response, homologs of TerZ and putative cAMP-binding protein CABP1